MINYADLLEEARQALIVAGVFMTDVPKDSGCRINGLTAAEWKEEVLRPLVGKIPRQDPCDDVAECLNGTRGCRRKH